MVTRETSVCFEVDACKLRSLPFHSSLYTRAERMMGSASISATFSRNSSSASFNCSMDRLVVVLVELLEELLVAVVLVLALLVAVVVFGFNVVTIIEVDVSSCIVVVVVDVDVDADAGNDVDVGNCVFDELIGVVKAGDGISVLDSNSLLSHLVFSPSNEPSVVITTATGTSASTLDVDADVAGLDVDDDSKW